MWHLRPLPPTALLGLAQQHRSAEFSYPQPSTTRHWQINQQPQPIPGYRIDQNSCVLGQGETCYYAAVAALRAWRMFPQWAQATGTQGQEEGSIIQLQFHLLGLHWHSLGRVVYAFEEENTAGALRREGFAYGTLPQHVERGEERFSVALTHDNRVIYELQAYSQPQYWAAKLAPSLARRYQQHFVRDSKAAFQNYVSSKLSC
jgi:uncharacterized protein (UPF0548 family)